MVPELPSSFQKVAADFLSDSIGDFYLCLSIKKPRSYPTYVNSVHAPFGALTSEAMGTYFVRVHQSISHCDFYT